MDATCDIPTGTATMARRNLARLGNLQYGAFFGTFYVKKEKRGISLSSHEYTAKLMFCHCCRDARDHELGRTRCLFFPC